MLTYIFIFVSKIIENALATLRLILVSNGKKMIGAILQFCIALLWILVTGAVVVNLNKDPLKIIFFCFGSLVGSYVGSILEEKIALGDSLITCITDNDEIFNILNSYGYNITKINSENKNNSKNVLLITTARKKKNHTINVIRNFDSKATIICEIVKVVN